MYIQGNSANDLDVIMHELGHTQGLSHSGKGWDEVRGGRAGGAHGCVMECVLCWEHGGYWDGTSSG